MALPNRVTNDIQDLIGTTPVVRLNRMATDADAEVVAKLELLNPARTVKDRIAAAMIDDAVQRGALRAGMTIVESALPFSAKATTLAESSSCLTRRNASFSLTSLFMTR